MVTFMNILGIIVLLILGLSTLLGLIVSFIIPVIEWNKEKNEKRKLARRYMDIDPYGEEDWGY